MLVAFASGDFIGSSIKVDHWNIEYVFSSPGLLSSSPSSISSLSSWKFRECFSNAFIHLLHNMMLSFNNISLNNRLHILLSPATIHQTNGLYTATTCCTADIFWPSSISHLNDSSSRRRFHSTTSRSALKTALDCITASISLLLSYICFAPLFLHLVNVRPRDHAQRLQLAWLQRT